MTSEDIQAMQTIIESTIKETVNGKIDKISNKLDTHIQQHEEDRKEMQPMFDAFTGKSWFTKQLAGGVIMLGGFGGLMAGIAEILNLFVHK